MVRGLRFDGDSHLAIYRDAPLAFKDTKPALKAGFRIMRMKRPLREPVRDAPGPKLKNYITPAGLLRLRDEYRFLTNRERPAVTRVVAWAASNGDRTENADYLYGKRRLRQIDSRIRFLTKRIDAAAVVDPAASRPR